MRYRRRDKSTRKKSSFAEENPESEGEAEKYHFTARINLLGVLSHCACCLLTLFLRFVVARNLRGITTNLLNNPKPRPSLCGSVVTATVSPSLASGRRRWIRKLQKPVTRSSIIAYLSRQRQRTTTRECLIFSRTRLKSSRACHNKKSSSIRLYCYMLSLTIHTHDEFNF
jgi:hypothetical protein